MTDELGLQILAELRAIRELLERRQVPRSDQHVALVQAIAQAAGASVFSTKELIAHAQEVDGDLRAALLASCGLSARRLGKALRRLEGVECGGFLIERCGQEADGVSWVCRVSARTSMLAIA